LKGDVRRVELQVSALKDEVHAAQTARHAEIDSMLVVLAALRQALAQQHAYLVQMRGDSRTDLLAVQQQLVAIQELTGQSQQRLTELRTRLEAQARQPVPAPPPDTSAAAAPPAGQAPGNAGGAGAGAASGA